MFELLVALSEGPPIIAGLWTAQWWRSGRRSRAGRCGNCARPWDSGTENRFLVGGRLICSTCAGTIKKGMPWELGALSLILAGTAVLGLIVAEGLAWVLGPLVAFPLGIGVLQLLKLANRRAQMRIATGESSDSMPENADPPVGV